MTVLVLVETVVLAVLTVLVAGLLRAYGTVLARLHQLDGGAAAGPRDFELLPLARPVAPGPVAPVLATSVPAATAPSAVDPVLLEQTGGEAVDITGETLEGELVSARVARVEHDTLLLFLSSGCSSCAVFWSELARPAALPAGVRLLVVTQSAQDESRAELAALAPPGVDVLLSTQAWQDYGVPGSPHVVLVAGPAGRIRGEGTGQSLAQVVALLDRSAGPDARPGAGVGAALHKSGRDAEQELAVDRELLAAGIRPGDPRLYGHG